MPRHTFRFPDHVRRAVRQHIESAVARLEATRFRQEPNYTAALANAIKGTAYKGVDGAVIFTATPFDDRGPGAAENQFGADLAITAEIFGNGNHVRKAILIQAKFGTIAELDDRRRSSLNVQIQKMASITRSPKVMELPLEGNVRAPRIISGQRVLHGEPYRSMALSSYITARVLTTLDGNTSRPFVDAVQDSSLAQLRIKARSGRP